MAWKVLIAHANDEEALAEELAGPIRDAGYEVAHQGTVLVGESVVEEASKILSSGGPVVICGTVRALGTGWAHKIVNAARKHQARIFAVQMEEAAYLQQLSLDEEIALYWQDKNKAKQGLVSSLKKHFPLNGKEEKVNFGEEVEERYRELALAACDIIDLANLPEDDRHMATRQLELRRLFVSLRVDVESSLNPTDEITGPEPKSINPTEKDNDTSEQKSDQGDTSIQGGTEEEPNLKGVPVGSRLNEAKRLIVLGDPGAGKTTMLRWIATAYLLRLKQDPDWKDLPDVATLPDENWLPILVRCRDLDQSSLNGTLADILRHTLRRTEIADNEVEELLNCITKKLKQGQALLMLDGLDEISSQAARIRFCRQLEQIQTAYPDAPIIATSRIVGYREMSYRIRRGFEHLTVADLTSEDKDDFARRWCAVTEPSDRRDRATEELIQDIHSSDRIESLTGNPMLLTTMALVKRKIGRLPSRRAELYWDALTVLLNWRREVDDPIDQREAVPQLEYVAYAMCDRGVQQIGEDEIIQLLEKMREEYPQIQAISNRTPVEFLKLLESRTGIMAQSGFVRERDKTTAVYQFRHLTFQEYLAGRALVEGRFPGRDRSKSLAERISPLAGRTDKNNKGDDSPDEEEEVSITESWKEALRLSVATCSDDYVDDALLAILNPTDIEDPIVLSRPRALLAALCLTDEPNVSLDVVKQILKKFVSFVDAKRYTRPTFEGIAVGLANSPNWSNLLQSLLIEKFRIENSKSHYAWYLLSLCGTIGGASAPRENKHVAEWLSNLTSKINSDDGDTAIKASLAVLEWAFKTSGREDIAEDLIPKKLVDNLIKSLSLSDFVRRVSAAWALGWLGENPVWKPSKTEMNKILSLLGKLDMKSDEETSRYLIWIFGKNPTPLAFQPLSKILKTSKNTDLQETIIRVLGKVGGDKAVKILPDYFNHENESIQLESMRSVAQFDNQESIDILMDKLSTMDAHDRIEITGVIANNQKDKIDTALLSEDLDGMDPFIDPQEGIGEDNVQLAADKLKKTVDEIRQRYENLAKKYHLKLSWV